MAQTEFDMYPLRLDLACIAQGAVYFVFQFAAMNIVMEPI